MNKCKHMGLLNYYGFNPITRRHMYMCGEYACGEVLHSEPVHPRSLKTWSEINE